MKTITQLTAEYEAAKAAMYAARTARDEAMTAASPHKVGDEFTAHGTRFKVRRISPSHKKNEVYLDCYYWTASKKWSQGGKVVTFPVGP